MENIICIFLLILTFIMYKIVLKINIKKAREIENNKELEKITNKFPDNKEIAKEMLEMLDNKDVKIEEAKDTKTSLYIAITNKIIIADMKENYGRIQTIAHECLHSCQDKRLIMFNFIFSNINILYFVLALILTIFKVFNNTMLQMFILMLFALISFSIRSFLEIDAMTRARFLAEKYMNNKKICTEQEKYELLKSYDEINKIGIPFVIDNLLSGAILKIIIYAIVAIII